jgi:hypothetical protein
MMNSAACKYSPLNVETIEKKTAHDVSGGEQARYQVDSFAQLFRRNAVSQWYAWADAPPQQPDLLAGRELSRFLSIEPGHGNLPTIVSPPTTCWPGATSTRQSTGKYASVREPNMIIPKRSPLANWSPVFAWHTILRAITPATWTTPNRLPRSSTSRSAFCSFCALESSL